MSGDIGERQPAPSTSRFALSLHRSTGPDTPYRIGATLLAIRRVVGQVVIIAAWYSRDLSDPLMRRLGVDVESVMPWRR